MAALRKTSSLLGEDDLEGFIMETDSVSPRGPAKTNVFDWSDDEDSTSFSSYQGDFSRSSSFGSRVTDSATRDFMKTSLKAANMEVSEDKPVGPAWGGEAFAVAEVRERIPAANYGSKALKAAGRTPSEKKIETQRPLKTDKPKSARAASQPPVEDVDPMRTRSTLSSRATVPSAPAAKDDISEVVQNMSQVSTEEFKRINNELQKSKKMILDLQSDRWRALPVKEMIHRIILGKSFSLSTYKSMREKNDLLSQAVNSNDGNAILAIVLFLKKTLKKNIFINLLSSYTTAFDHYEEYLNSSGQSDELLSLYRSVGRIADCAMSQYARDASVKEPSERLQCLQQWLKDYGHVPELSETRDIVKEQINLIRWQIPLEKRDKERELEVGNTLMKRYPRKSSILLQSLLTTSYYCAFYHYDEKSNKYHPDTLRKEFKLSDKQYEWTVLPARAKLHKWADVSEILTGLDWKRKRSNKSAIGFDKVSTIICTSGAPLEIKEEYLRLIPKVEIQLKLAEKYHCHSVVIDALVALKDRRRLEEYRLKVEHDHLLRRKVADILRNTDIKWKQPTR